MATTMRAKMYVESIQQFGHGGKVTQETLKLRCVSDKPYGANGESEDNTFAKYSPSGELSISITNEALHGQFKPGEKFYLDFTPASE